MAPAKTDYGEDDEFEDEDDEDDEDDDDEDDDEDEDDEFDEDDDEEDEEESEDLRIKQRAGKGRESKPRPRGPPQIQTRTSEGIDKRTETPLRESNREPQALPQTQKGTAGSLNDKETPRRDSKRGPRGLPGGMNDRESNRGRQDAPQSEQKMRGSSANDQYVQIAPLPIFKGEEGECPASHIAKFLRICRANNAATPEMWIRLFPVSLEGEAALWYEFNVDGEQLAWEEIKAFFIQTFRRSENVDQFRVELTNLRIGAKERVSAFFLRMQCILRRWPNNELPDSFLKGSFIDGLQEDCQDWIVLRNPPDLRAAVSLALQWEEAQNFKARRKSSASGQRIESDGERDPGRKCQAEGCGEMLKEMRHWSQPIWCSGCRFQWPRRIEPETCGCRRENGNNKPFVCQQKQTVASQCGFCEGDHPESTCEVRHLMKELWKISRRKMNLLAGYEIPSIQKSQCGCGVQDMPFSVKSIHNPLYQCTASSNRVQEVPCVSVERPPPQCCCRCWGHRLNSEPEWGHRLNSEPELQNLSCRCAYVSGGPKTGPQQEHCCCMCSIHNLSYQFPVQRM